MIARVALLPIPAPNRAMKILPNLTAAISLTLAAVAGANLAPLLQEKLPPPEVKPLESLPLGAFSTSLAVKDIKASKAFYEKLDFIEAGGDIKQNWLIMRSNGTTIGLFQGMFEDNVMTFNPGWGPNATALKEFTDVREIQAEFIERGIKPIIEAKPEGDGPAHFVLADPDGNQIFFDQHVKRPKR